MSVGWGGLELQLRALRNVVAASFAIDDDQVVVQLLVEAEADEVELRRLVVDLTMPVADRPVSVEVAWLDGSGEQAVTADGAPRVRLAAVWTEAMTGRIKVELTSGGRAGNGLSAGGGADAAAEATLGALNDLGAGVAFVPETAEGALGNSGSHLVEVALLDGDGGRRYGIARADSVEVAAARATLNALNRYLARQPPLKPSADLAAPGDAADPRDAAEPTGAAEPTREAAESTRPADPTGVADPADPTASTDPVKPTAPLTSTGLPATEAGVWTAESWAQLSSRWSQQLRSGATRWWASFKASRSTGPGTSGRGSAGGRSWTSAPPPGCR